VSGFKVERADILRYDRIGKEIVCSSFVLQRDMFVHPVSPNGDLA
jgi:hypothetical protein